VYEFRVGDEVFHARIDHGRIEALHGPAQHPDVTITISEAAFVDVTRRVLTLAEAIETGAASASGDSAALRSLKSLFRLPPECSRGRTTDRAPSPRSGGDDWSS
jgi:alkyl sulfatase BDS1-like metallo-beta-lactamase superfamily hydrolase